MPLRFRILAAASAARAAWAQASASTLAEGPSAELAVELLADLDEVRIGRQPDVEIELPFPAVSSLHARLVRGELALDWRVEDLGSMNGTWLDGERLSPHRPVTLRSGQRLRLATVDVVFEGWSAKARGDESTASIARRLISDLFGAVGGDVPRLVAESGLARRAELRLLERERRYLAGRADSCDLVLATEHVSREHAAFVRRADGVVLLDLGSRNGLLVNGEPVTGERRLGDGDRITLGTVALRLTDPEDRYLRRLESLAPEPAASAQPPGAPAAPVPVRVSAEMLSTAARSRASSGGTVASGARNAPTIAPTPASPPTPSATPALSPPSLSAPPAASSRLLIFFLAAVAILSLSGLAALWLTTH